MPDPKGGIFRSYDWMEEAKKKAEQASPTRPGTTKLPGRTFKVAPPSEGNKPTKAASKGAKAGARTARVGHPTDRPQNEMDRRKAEAEKRRLARNRARRG